MFNEDVTIADMSNVGNTLEQISAGQETQRNLLTSKIHKNPSLPVLFTNHFKTNKLTTKNRVMENLIVAQLIDKFTRSFITKFTKTTGPYPEPN
jgi:hypothetical protein